MQALLLRHPARWLVALLAILILAIGLATSISQAQGTGADCDDPVLDTEPMASDAGGTLITVATACTGNAEETLEILVRRGDATLLKAILEKSVTGQLRDTDTIHLPVLLEEEVCASIVGKTDEVCTPAV